MLKIILIDDDSFAINTIADVVPWQNYGFELAGVFLNGESALKYLEEHKIDVIITDIQMYEMTGLDLVRICETKYPDMKIVLLSAYRDFEYARAAINLRNVVDYLTKPLDFEQFFNILEKIRSEKQELHMGFRSPEEYDKRLEFFSNLLYGNPGTYQEIREKFVEYGIEATLERTPCSLVNFHIDDFEHFVTKVWKHGIAQLFRAINNIVQYESEKMYYFLVNYSYGNIVFLLIHKSEEDIEEQIASFSDYLAHNMESFLKMKVVMNSLKTYNNMLDFLRLPEKTKVESDEDEIILRAINYMNENYATVSLNDVANYVFLSPPYFSAFFKKITGEKFITRLTRIRMEHAVEILVSQDISVESVCKMVGYSHMGHFTEQFKKVYDMTPTEYRIKYRGNKK